MAVATPQSSIQLCPKVPPLASTVHPASLNTCLECPDPPQTLDAHPSDPHSELPVSNKELPSMYKCISACAYQGQLSSRALPRQSYFSEKGASWHGGCSCSSSRCCRQLPPQGLVQCTRTCSLVGKHLHSSSGSGSSSNHSRGVLVGARAALLTSMLHCVSI